MAAEIALSHCVGLIYDCALDVASWPTALEATADYLGAANGALALTDITNFAELLNVTVGVAEPFRSRMGEYMGDVADLWSSFVFSPAFPTDQPFAATRDLPAERMQANRYVREWAAPQGLVDMIGLLPMRQPDRIASFGFGVRAPTTDEQMARARLVAPHLRRSVTIGNLIESYKRAASSQAAALDRLSVGVLLTDRLGRIAHANAAAEAMLRDKRGLKVARGRVEAIEPAAQAELNAALAAAGGPQLGGAAIGLALSAPGAAPMLAYVLPLAPARAQELNAGAASAAIFIRSAETAAMSSEKAISEAFGLTPAEARVMSKIAAGAPPAVAAQELGVSEATVRTHLSRIFHKTGVTRQADLAGLIGSLSAPLRAPEQRDLG